MNFVEEFDQRIKSIEDKLFAASQKNGAELTAIKARLEKDAQQKLQSERAKLALRFVEVLDELERAYKHGSEGDGLREGVEIIIDLFRNRLESLGVSRIMAQGAAYDPHNAQAIGTESGPEGIVTLEVQAGYMLDGQLIRPAKVLVGSGEVALVKVEAL